MHGVERQRGRGLPTETLPGVDPQEFNQLRHVRRSDGQADLSQDNQDPLNPVILLQPRGGTLPHVVHSLWNQVRRIHLKDQRRDDPDQ